MYIHIDDTMYNINCIACKLYTIYSERFVAIAFRKKNIVRIVRRSF